MKLFAIAAALASMATLASAQQWRVRLYERTGTSGGSNVDFRGTVGSVLTCQNVPNPPATGDRSLRFEDDAPNSDRVSIWTVPSCSGTPATVYGPGVTGTLTVATLFPASPTGARSFSVNT